MHHHLGFEQPDRIGLHGLFSLLDPEPARPASADRAVGPDKGTPVATSTGARTPATRQALRRFQGWLDDQQRTDAHDAAA